MFNNDNNDNSNDNIDKYDTYASYRIVSDLQNASFIGPADCNAATATTCRLVSLVNVKQA